MRFVLGLAVSGVWVLAAGAAAAGERDDALAVVNRAITAHGGADALAKAQVATRTGAGMMTLFGSNTPFTDEVAWSLPERLRVAVELDKKYKLTMVLNGGKGWQSAGASTTEIGPERLKELREEAYVLWLTTLVPLKQDGFDLAPLPEVMVSGQPAVGVKVTSKGHTGVKMYFDKKSNLLVKVERRAEEAGQMLDKEYFYSDHKDFDGVKLPTKQVEVLNGKKFTELSAATYKLLRKADDSAFAKP